MNTVREIRPRTASSWSFVLSIILIVSGLFAIGLPGLASLGFTRLLAWLVLFDGIVQLFHAFRSYGIGSLVAKILVAFLYVGVGIGLLTHTLIGMAALTLVLAGLFLTEAVLKVFYYVSERKRARSGWILLSALATMIFAIMIWRHWPSSSLWAIGTLIGLTMLMTGIANLMMALAVATLAKNEGHPRALVG